MEPFTPIDIGALEAEKKRKEAEDAKAKELGAILANAKANESTARMQADYDAKINEPLVQPSETDLSPDPKVTPQFPMSDPKFGGPIVQKSVKDVSTTTEGTKVSDASKLAHAGRVNAMDEGRSAIQKDTDANVAAANAELEGKRLIEKNAADAALEDTKREQLGKDLSDRKAAEFETEKKKLADNKYEGFWANKSTGNRALAAIALAMGAFRSSATGGENKALTILDGAIKDDYAQWDDRYKAQERALVRSGADADKVAERFETMRAARKVSTAQAVRDKAATLVAATGSDKAKAAGQALIAGLDERIATANAEFADLSNKRVQTTVHQTTTMMDPAAVPGGGKGGIFGPDGQLLGTTGDPKRDDEIRKIAAPYAQFDSLIGGLIDNYKEHGREINPKSTAAQQRSAIFGKLRIAVKNSEELGALVGKDWELIEDQIGKGGAMYAVDPTDMLVSTRQLTQDGARMKIGSLGFDGNKIVGAGVGQPGPAAKPTDTDKAAAMKWLRENPNHPRAAQVRASMQAAVRG